MSPRGFVCVVSLGFPDLDVAVFSSVGISVLFDVAAGLCLRCFSKFLGSDVDVSSSVGTSDPFDVAARLSCHWRGSCSGTYVPDSLCRAVIQPIIHSIGLYRLESLHPVVFSSFQEPTILGLRIRVVVFHLFYQRESRMSVKIVIGKCEVSVERSPAGVSNVVSVGVHAKVCRRFTLANILCSWT